MTTASARPRTSVCPVSELPHFSDLPDDTLRNLAAACRRLKVEAGGTLAHGGEEAEYVTFVLEGFLRMQKTLSDGRQHIVGLLVEGDMFGKVFDGPQEFEIEAATDAEVCIFRRAAFEQLLLDSPELERVVLRNIMTELDRARDWMVILSSQRVSQRLAGFLLVLCTRYAAVDHVLSSDAGSLDIKIPIGRSDLAHLLGTRPESISRAFHALADTGHIALLRHDLVRILDLEALAEAAGDEDLADKVNLAKLLDHQKRRA